MKSAAHKPTRALIHKLHAALGPGGAVSNTETDADRLITALRTRDHPRARALLAGIKTPKLGSLQRWVRECDAASIADPDENQQNETWKTLEAIIRTTTPNADSQTAPVKATLMRFPAWQPSIEREGDSERIYEQVLSGSIASKLASELAGGRSSN